MVAKKTKTADGWRGVKMRIDDWETRELLGLIRDLYSMSPANRDFIDARTAVRTGLSGGEAALERYRGKILAEFNAERYDVPRLAEIRRALREYRKATGNVAGYVELLVTYVLSASEYLKSWGDLEERYYDSFETAWAELCRLLLGEASEVYPKVRDRILKAGALVDGYGWGYGDFVGETVWTLEEEHGYSPEA